MRRRTPGARPAPHKAPALTGNIFERDLDKNTANYATLTPLQFLERTASVYPGRLALVHGPRRQTWAETYTRCRRLASALEKAGIGKGDTVTIMAPISACRCKYACSAGCGAAGSSPRSR